MRHTVLILTSFCPGVGVTLPPVLAEAVLWLVNIAELWLAELSCSAVGESVVTMAG